MAHYGHDLYGALRQGYIRRCREAGFRMLKETRGRLDPMGGHEGSDYATFGLALGTLIQCAEHSGIPTEEIRRNMLNKAERWDESHNPLEGSSLRQFEENMDGDNDDPVETGNLGWENYDAEVDAMSKEGARETLKQEARLRKEAQIEATALRAALDKQTQTQ